MCTKGLCRLCCTSLANAGRFTIVAAVLQVVFIVLFGVFVRYSYLPQSTHLEVRGGGVAHRIISADELAEKEVAKHYTFFQDIHVMIFIGFGFLMTFLKRYGFSSVALNMLVAALVLQWAILTGGWIFRMSAELKIHVHMKDMISAEFAAATVLISFGAVLGKINALQLLVMAMIEVVFFQVNEYIVFKLCKASDVGDSMVVHVFGAYFGLTVSRVLYTDGIRAAKDKEASVYHSDLFAMIGTIFLWLFWPSFNCGGAVGEGQYRAVINTYFSLAACVVVSFAVSALVHKNKFNMVHIQNATLAGGVAIGTMADMVIQPWGALIVGSGAAVFSVLGYRFMTPCLMQRFKIHDTCGVNNLHGLPGILAGIGGVICAATATPDLYGTNLWQQFPNRVNKSAGIQAAFQVAALASSIIVAFVGGLAAGVILRFRCFDQPRELDLFDDSSYWLLPEGFPGGVNRPVEESDNTEKVLVYPTDESDKIDRVTAERKASKVDNVPTERKKSTVTAKSDTKSDTVE